MPPTLVNVAVGILLGCALLGAAFDRRSIAVVALAAALPDLDAAASLVLHGATNALLHNVFVPTALAVGLYYDTTVRDGSWLRTRCGRYGVRVAWVALAAYVVGGIGADLFNIEAVALLYPATDTFYAVVGRLVLSTQDGLVQTYVTTGGSGLLEVRTRGTTATYHVYSWVNPTPGTSNPPGAERRVRVVDSGWQLVAVVAAGASVVARTLADGRRPDDRRPDGPRRERGST